MNGWLNLYKPLDVSSAFFLAKVKKIFSLSKVGHAGTLDPKAEGVLPVAVGSATKLIRITINEEKEYIFTIKFGIKTDSGDIAGKIIDTSNIIPNKEQSVGVVSKFIGDIMQTPHKYSAIKLNGVRAYKAARLGQDFELPKRNIHIYNLECTNYDNDENSATYKVLCSKGTYIRTLAEDIANELQTVGFVTKLCRTRVGNFCSNNSIFIETIQNNPQFDYNDFVDKFLLPPEYILKDIDEISVDNFVAKKILYGQNVYFEPEIYQREIIWISYKKKVLAIGTIKNSGLLKIFRVFSNYVEL